MKSHILAQLMTDIKASFEHTQHHYASVMSDLWRAQRPDEASCKRLAYEAKVTAIHAEHLRLYVERYLDEDQTT